MPKLLTRFLVVSDLHHHHNGWVWSDRVNVHQDNTSSPSPSNTDDRMDFLVDRVNAKNQEYPCDFILINGDLCNSSHNTVEDNEELRDNYINNFDIPYYVSYGNHDRLSDEDWQSVWGTSRSHVFTQGDFAFIVLNSSNTSGSRSICRDKSFFINALEEYKNSEGIFVCSHIPRYQAGFEDFKLDGEGLVAQHSSDSPQCDIIMNEIDKYDNIISHINSHFHAHMGIWSVNGIPVVKTGHFGNYGMDYYSMFTIEIYDNGETYAYLDGFEGEKENEEWNVTIRDSRIFRLSDFRNIKTVTGKKVFYPINL